METHALVVGRSYAFRTKRDPSEQLLKVRLLDIVGRKGKVKVRFEGGPHPGLEEYVSTRQLIVPWGARQALLRDEQQAARLDGYARTVQDYALAEAANAVLTSTGEPGAYAAERGTSFDERELQRILDRAGLEDDPARLHPYAYRDRHGHVHLPLDAVVRIAQAFAAAEPKTVTAFLDDEEEELRLKGNLPGARSYHDYLRRLGPAHALARRWAGLDQEAEQLRREIARLRLLVSSAAYDLKAGGHDQKSARLLRALEGR